MAQQGLFNLKKKGGKRTDSKLLNSKHNRRDAVEVTYISGDKLKDAINRARVMSKRA